MMFKKRGIQVGVVIALGAVTSAPAFAQADSVGAGRHLVGSMFSRNPDPPGTTTGPVPYSQIGVDLNGKKMFVGVSRLTYLMDGDYDPNRPPSCEAAGEYQTCTVVMNPTVIDAVTVRTGWLFSFAPDGMKVISYKNYDCRGDTCQETGGRHFDKTVAWNDSFNSVIQLRGCGYRDRGWGFCNQDPVINAGWPDGYYFPVANDQIMQPGMAFDFVGDANIKPITRRVGSDGVDRPVLTVNLFLTDEPKYPHRFKSQGRYEWVGGLSTRFSKIEPHQNNGDLGGGSAIPGLADIGFNVQHDAVSTCVRNCLPPPAADFSGG